MKTPLFRSPAAAAMMLATLALSAAAPTPTEKPIRRPSFGPPDASLAVAPADKTDGAPATVEKKRGFFSRLLRPGGGASASEPDPTTDKSAGVELSAPTPAPKRPRPSGKSEERESAAPATPPPAGPNRPVAPAERNTKPESPEPPDKPSFLSRLVGKRAPEERQPPAVRAIEPPRKVHPATIAPARPELGTTAARPDQFVITKDETPFFSFGPNQATPPDAYLGTGTLVTITSKSWGWAQVTLADGRAGMIARDAMRQATIFDLPPPPGPTKPLFAGSSAPRSTPSPPAYVVPSEPLPELPAVEVLPVPAGEELSTSLLPPFQE